MTPPGPGDATGNNRWTTGPGTGDGLGNTPPRSPGSVATPPSRGTTVDGRGDGQSPADQPEHITVHNPQHSVVSLDIHLHPFADESRTAR